MTDPEQHQRDREIREAAEMSTAYGRMLIHYTFILNGGALVALPAFQDNLKGLIEGNGWLSPLAFFCGLFFGIACAITTHLQAYIILKHLKRVDFYGNSSVTFSKFWNGILVCLLWGLGVLSYVGFFVGSVMLLMRLKAIA